MSYNTPGKASYLATFFYQLGGLFVSWMGSLIVGGVVLRSDALARALILNKEENPMTRGVDFEQNFDDVILEQPLSLIDEKVVQLPRFYLYEISSE